ncbi:MAG: ERF family protein [Eubacterium sp.]|nr:ERF family protein [Eubacterium sp.]
MVEGGSGIRTKLMHIQTELKAPKNLYNSFGKYKYRNLEGICESVKPLLAKYGLAMTMEDSVRLVGDRVYVRAYVLLMDIESKETVDCTAYAREASTKKGMDDSQITGTASSYARKYALSGLFLLDDTKDADTDEYHTMTTRTKKATKAKDPDPEPEDEIERIKNQPIGKTKAVAFAKKLKAEGISAAFVCGLYSVAKLSEMTEEMLSNANERLKEIKSKQEEEEAKNE